MSKTYTRKIGEGVLFRNTKPRSDSSPWYTGRIQCEDGEHWLSAWIHTPASGYKYISLATGDLCAPRDDKPVKGKPVDVSDDILD